MNQLEPNKEVVTPYVEVTDLFCWFHCDSE